MLYEIKVDNTGDGEEDLAYQFRFNTTTRNPNTFLYATGPIGSLSDPNWNRPQTYDVTSSRSRRTASPGRATRTGRSQLNSSPIPTPPDNVGPRSTPNYDALATAAITSLPGGIKVFAGQRDDPFFVDLGSIFDLGGLRPFNPFHLIPLAAEPGVDAVKNYNTHTIAIQVPISQLVQAPSSTIGIYASASRQKQLVLQNDGTTDGKGDWVQVSRLGNPLINEVVIPLGQKDFWNRVDPEDDGQFEGRYTTPEVAHLENLLYGAPPTGHPGGALQPIDETGRTDLSLILLTGVPGLNFTGSTDADLLRLNTAITPGADGACPGGTASPAAPDRLGVLSADLCGFPNGRRLGDDVIDIELRAIGQGYGTFLNTAFGLPNKSPNNLVGDGVDGKRQAVPQPRSRMSHRPARATRCPSGAQGSGRMGRGWRCAPPHRPRPRGEQMRRRRLILGGTAAGLTALALLLGGVLRESSSASRTVVAPPPTSAQLETGFSPGNTAGAIASLQATLRVSPNDVKSLDLLGLAYQQAARETGDSAYYTKSAQALRARARALARRSRRDGRPRLARALAPPFRRGARSRQPRPRHLSDDGSQLRRDRRRARRARPVQGRFRAPSTRCPLCGRASRRTRASRTPGS